MLVSVENPCKTLPGKAAVPGRDAGVRVVELRTAFCFASASPGSSRVFISHRGSFSLGPQEGPLSVPKGRLWLGTDPMNVPSRKPHS